MFDDILIGVDGRHGGHDAVALARRLASEDSRFTFAHIYGAGLMPGQAAALLLASEREQACALLAREREEAGLDAQLIPCAERSIGRGLRQITISHGSDLLVIGRGHHGLFGRTFHLDDTSSAVNVAPCPIAVAAVGYAQAPTPLLRIGIGYDESPESEQALAVARSLAEHRPGATLKGMTVIKHRTLGGGDTARSPGGRPQPSELDRSRLRELGGLDCDVVDGNPGEVLESFSRDLDLLIVGSRSHGPIARLFSGNTSNHLARNAHCAVLVVPRGDTGVADVADVADIADVADVGDETEDG